MRLLKKEIDDYLITRNVSILNSTENAWLVIFKDGETGWIPKKLFKVVHTHVDDLKKVKVYTITIPRWLEKSIFVQYHKFKKKQNES